MNKIADSGVESMENVPLTVQTGCSLKAAITITPKFELKVLWTAAVTLGPKITLNGAVDAPAKQSYHGSSTNCECGQNHASIGSDLGESILPEH
jgi:hypothetical protein